MLLKKLGLDDTGGQVLTTYEQVKLCCQTCHNSQFELSFEDISVFFPDKSFTVQHL